MSEKTLIKGAKENLALLGKSGILTDAYLAGGTALALQLGHEGLLEYTQSKHICTDQMLHGRPSVAN